MVCAHTHLYVDDKYYAAIDYNIILYRYMYWSDWGDEARIERAGMDGSNRTILHTTNLIWPNGITIDYGNQRIYWTDASLDTVEYSNMDGTGRTLLERVNDEIFHPFSITLTNELLFWTDWNQLSIFSTHKDLPNDNIISLYSQLVDRPHGIEAVTPDRQTDGMTLYSAFDCNFNVNSILVGTKCCISIYDVQLGDIICHLYTYNL